MVKPVKVIHIKWRVHCEKQGHFQLEILLNNIGPLTKSALLFATRKTMYSELLPLYAINSFTIISPSVKKSKRGYIKFNRGELIT